MKLMTVISMCDMPRVGGQLTPCRPIYSPVLVLLARTLRDLFLDVKCTSRTETIVVLLVDAIFRCKLILFKIVSRGVLPVLSIVPSQTPFLCSNGRCFESLADPISRATASPCAIFVSLAPNSCF